MYKLKFGLKILFLLILISIFVLLSNISTILAEPQLPKPENFGVEIAQGKVVQYEDELTALAPDYLRITTGHYLYHTDTLYQHYLSGGWAAVDAELLPDLTVINEIGATPLVRFMYGTPTCTVPTQTQLDAYAIFVAQAAARYNLQYIEVWNEPDTTTGNASLSGCFGDLYTTKLNKLLDDVQALAPTRQVGVSFMMDSAAMYSMLQSAVPHADWIGVHHYDVYAEDAQGNGSILYTYPGSENTPGFKLKLTMAQSAAQGKPVWVTETNLRSPMYFCTENHKAAARQYIAHHIYRAIQDKNIPMWSVLVFQDYPDWQCTGIRNTPTHQYLLDGSGGIGD